MCPSDDRKGNSRISSGGKLNFALAARASANRSIKNSDDEISTGSRVYYGAESLAIILSSFPFYRQNDKRRTAVHVNCCQTFSDKISTEYGAYLDSPYVHSSTKKEKEKKENCSKV